MQDPTDRLLTFFRELKRRNVYRVAGTYAVVAFVIWQVASHLFPALGFPGWTTDFVVVLTLLGFPVALVLAWALELTPGGIRSSSPTPTPASKTRGREDTAPERPARRRRIYLFLAALLLLGGLGYGGFHVVGSEGGSAAEVPEIRSLAVLPLDNLSGDPEQEYFTDGMTEALTAELGQIGALKVISRTSAMRFAETDRSMPEIARELAVDGLIEGSVLKAGEKVRITLQLVHGPTDRHLWAKSYERGLEDVLALQGEVARALAEEIRLTLAPEEKAQLVRAGTVDPEAYEAYLRGRYRYARVTEEDHRAAISQYREALAHDSSFAAAYAALAEVCVHPSVLGKVTRLPDCRGWGTRAVQLAPDLAKAHAGLGRVKFAEWDWRGSEAAFRRAIDLNPNSVMARTGYADLLWVTMRPEAALEQARRAEELDPLNLFVKTAVSWPLIVQRRYEEALAQLDAVLEMDPDFWLPIWNRGEILVSMGRAEEALEAGRRLAELPARGATVGSLSLRAGGLAVLGEEERALEILAEIEERFADVVPARIGLVHLRLGRQEEALDWLERALRIRAPELIRAMSAPVSDVLRPHPRFRALQRKMGLDRYIST